MLAEAEVRQAAASLVAARRERRPVPPLRETYPGLDVDGAYAVQSAAAGVREQEEGDEVVGHEVGLTSRAMQEMLGVDTPDFGRLWASETVRDADPTSGATPVLDAGRYVAPRIEPEIAFVLSRRPGGRAPGPARVLHARRARGGGQHRAGGLHRAGRRRGAFQRLSVELVLGCTSPSPSAVRLPGTVPVSVVTRAACPRTGPCRWRSR